MTDADEAEKRLQQIKSAQQAAEAVGQREAGYFLNIWGFVWLIGFLLSQYAAVHWLSWVWLALCFLGGLLSAVVGVKLGRQVQYARTGPQLGGFYAVLIGFSLLWLWQIRPSSWQETAVFIMTIIGFGVVVNGILLKKRPFIVVGIAGAVFAVAIYLLLLPQFGLIMALVGGGSMILAGVRLLWAGQ